MLTIIEFRKSNDFRFVYMIFKIHNIFLNNLINFLESNYYILNEVYNFIRNTDDVSFFLYNYLDAPKARFHYKYRKYINSNFINYFYHI